ncbi:hypothetical protein [Fulvivirga ulvae]|nr:hypothetical protein [Fulvivirga ulvae]
MPFIQTVSHIHSDEFTYEVAVRGQPPGVVITLQEARTAAWQS